MRRTLPFLAIQYDRYNDHRPKPKTGETAATIAAVTFVAGATALGYCHNSYHRRQKNPFLMFTDPTANRAAKIWEQLTSPVIK